MNRLFSHSLLLLLFSTSCMQGAEQQKIDQLLGKLTPKEQAWAQELYHYDARYFEKDIPERYPEFLRWYTSISSEGRQKVYKKHQKKVSEPLFETHNFLEQEIKELLEHYNATPPIDNR